MKYSSVRPYLGSIEQLFSVRRSRIDGGRGDGVRVIDVSNGGDLAVTILPDRCLDIHSVRYRGKNLSYLAPNGISHPAYYNPFGEGWSESYYGGFLYTCGLSHVGIKDEDSWSGQKEHGSAANIPAENVNLDLEETENGPVLTLRAKVREAMLCGPNLVLERCIRIAWQKNEIELTDTVRNESYHDQPFSLLYHCNTGYPLLSEQAVLSIPHKAVRGRTPHAEAHIDRINEIWAPEDAMEEMCYYYEVSADENGWASVTLKNPAEGIGMEIAYDTATLDQFVQWKYFVKGEYVMGLEPCNATLDGAADAAMRGSQHVLKPWESAVHRVIFRFTAEGSC